MKWHRSLNATASAIPMDHMARGAVWSRPEARGPTHQDNEAHQLGVGALPSFARDDVPFLRGADDDLGGVDFFLAQLVVASQLSHGDAVSGQALQGGRKPTFSNKWPTLLNKTFLKQFHIRFKNRSNEVHLLA